MGTRRLTFATGLVLAGVSLAGCGQQGARPPAPTGSPTATSSPFSLYTHCGIKWIRIGDRDYLADHPLSDGHGNPPAGWGNPYQVGAITFPSSVTAIFTDGANHFVVFHLGERPNSEPLCS